MAFEFITDAEWAYLAGIIDGEGCIQIDRQRRKSNGGKVSQYHTLFVTVRNTDYSLVLWLANKFGGRPVPLSRITNRRQVWSWCLASQRADSVLRGVTQYLIVKKDQAELALQFRDSYRGIKPRSNYRLPVLVVDFRENCMNRMKEMKKQKPFVLEQRA